MAQQYMQTVEEHTDETTDINQLQTLSDTHKLWNNPLLQACLNGRLTLEDFKYLFSQYYFYSRNFTKLLAAAMVNCDSDYFRSIIVKNLFEESGGQNIEMRHSEIFRKFLVDTLGINLERIDFEPYTELFFSQYLDLCIHSGSTKGAAILSFGTEGIVAKLYAIFKKGLVKIGIKDDALTFFNIHIACDDEHALTLKEIVLSHRNEDNWLLHCKEAIYQALNLRDQFFTNIYKNIQSRRFYHLIEKISAPNKAYLYSDNLDLLHHNIEGINNKLYENVDLNKNINFTVDRIPFGADVLDPRVVHIPIGFNNELHSHAHETVFLILEGNGEVLINDNILNIKSGDVVFVPRWAEHQTRNTGDRPLKFFAITDYGFTKRLEQNTESVYRQKDNSMSQQNTLNNLEKL
jgi:mannose-6-phosphate isomerase-like protein (cupin superfamily)/pyrroloquinoline quinone (PQQ) biosynthesis protein C